MASEIQHEDAHKLLKIIEDSVTTNVFPVYREAARRLGRPETDYRTVAQTCDLLDAAAALSGIPLLAFYRIRESSGNINRKAWDSEDLEPNFRQAVIDQSKSHDFTKADYTAILKALDELRGRGNIKAWRYVREKFSFEEFYLRLAGRDFLNSLDAVNDLGTDTPIRINNSGMVYIRDPKIRAAVKRRANGKCEFCGDLGFNCTDGSRYLECHHIISLANDGADRMTNVIALCATDHRKAHFGSSRIADEKEMIRIVRDLETR
ncbi:MAG: HNH endonuclease [Beijerinckiaceae bacterium]